MDSRQLHKVGSTSSEMGWGESFVAKALSVHSSEGAEFFMVKGPGPPSLCFLHGGRFWSMGCFLAINCAGPGDGRT